MARIRSIKPEYWSDLAMSRVSRDARLLYVALWNQADEWARIHGDTRWVKGHCFPYDDDLSLDDMDALLGELQQARRVQRYVVAGEPFLYLPKLASHQRLEPAKTPSRLPEPPEFEKIPERSENFPESVTERSRSTTAPASPQVTASPLIVPDESENFPDLSAQIVVQQVAGSKLHVAGSREHVAGGRFSESDFQEFWTCYPKKVGKDAARRAFAAAVKRAGSSVVLAGVHRYATDPNRQQDPQFIPGAQRWLNEGRFADPLVESFRPTGAGQPGPRPLTPAEQTVDITRDLVARLQAEEQQQLLAQIGN